MKAGFGGGEVVNIPVLVGMVMPCLYQPVCCTNYNLDGLQCTPDFVVGGSFIRIF